MKFVKYHKIKQFRDVIKEASHLSRFDKVNEQGEVVHNNNPLPTIEFTGLVKLHGTNAQICYDPQEEEVEIKAGKRSSLINEKQTIAHFEFNKFVQLTHKEALLNWLSKYKLEKNEQLCIYGEWAGNGVQKNVAISELPKSFYIFDACVYNKETEETKWLDINSIFFRPVIQGIYNLFDFPHFKVKIDFENPKLSQNSLIDLTKNVEEECPVSLQLGKSGIGEGIVWTSFYKGQKLIFKVKGEKHSVSKVKTLVEIDPVKLKNVQDFVNRVCTKQRVLQGIQETECDDKSKIGDFLRWFANDVLTEENTILSDNDLEWRDVGKQVSTRARLMLFVELDKI